MQPVWPPSEAAASRPKYVGRIVPLVFPESADVPETQLHLNLRTLLYQLLSDYLGESATVGSDQFVYWDASNPKRCIAPDVYAKATPAGEPIRSWKVWERGAPDVAVEIISESDAPGASWDEKLAMYQAIGVTELVRLDLVSGRAPLRVWHRTQEVLTECETYTLGDDGAQVGHGVASIVFRFFWVLAPARGLDTALRIATQLAPLSLVPTVAEGREAERQAKEAERQAKEAERQAKEAAEARVRELEALLGSKK